MCVFMSVSSRAFHLRQQPAELKEVVKPAAKLAVVCKKYRFNLDRPTAVD